MTSQINPNNIDGTYPVAGVPNNTQGMRDNFTATKTNFQYASDEITELQSKSVLKSALSGSTLDNNMNDNLIYQVKLNDVCYTYLQNTATSGTVTLDYSASQFQYVSTTGSVSLAFTNWCPSGSAGALQFTINITNVAHTLTLPASVIYGLYGIQGISPGTAGVSNTITFGATGQYTFRFSSTDGGLTFDIFDFSRGYNQYAGNVYINGTATSTSTTTGALQVDGGVGIVGNLNVGGDFVTYSANNDPVFSVYAANGFVHINAPSISANSAGALNIVGSTDGSYQPVTQAGGMIHITGNDGVSSRITNDAFGTAAVPTIVGRRSRGTAVSPSVPVNNDVLLRFVGGGWNGVGYGPTAGTTLPTGIDFVAKETFSGTAMGSEIQFYNAPLTSNVRTLSATISSTQATFPGIVSATGNVISNGNILATDGGAVGYTNGAGGTVSQTGNKSTGVTLNKLSGEITMQATALGAGTSVSFTLTNSTIGAKDVMVINLVGGGTNGAYTYGIACSAGSALITVRNVTAGSLSEALVLRYVVIRGTTA